MIELERIGDLEGLEQERARIVHQDMGRAPVTQNAGAGPNHRRRLSQIAGHIVEAIPSTVLEAPREPYDRGAFRRERLGGGEPDPPGGTGHHGQSPCQPTHSNGRPCTRRRNSSRERRSLRKMPRTALVTVREFCFSTPRMAMQR